MNKEEITDFLVRHKAELEYRFGVERIGLFGSYARNEAGVDSDIDISVVLNNENIADSYFGVLHYLEDHLQHKIDLGLESSIRPEIREQIMKDIIYV